VNVPFAAVQTRTGAHVHATANRGWTLCGWNTHGGTYSNGTLVVTCYWCRLRLMEARARAGAQCYRIDALMGGEEV
jgi:hypothetical protein